jgi:hypothetical protein
MELLTLALLAAAALAVVILFSKIIRKLASKFLLFILNGMGGLILLLILVYVFGVEIPIKLATVGAVLIFGLPGLGCLLILHYSGMI